MKKLVLILFLAACDPMTPTEVEITQVKIVRGDPAGTDFLLRVEGRGFALGSITYHAGDGIGGEHGENRQLEIYDDISVSFMIPHQEITVHSPHQIDAHVVLEQRLAPGTYGVRLYEAGAELASAPLAFEVP